MPSPFRSRGETSTALPPNVQRLWVLTRDDAERCTAFLFEGDVPLLNAKAPAGKPFVTSLWFDTLTESRPVTLAGRLFFEMVGDDEWSRPMEARAFAERGDALAWLAHERQELLDGDWQDRELDAVARRH